MKGGTYTYTSMVLYLYLNIEMITVNRRRDRSTGRAIDPASGAWS